MTIKGYYYQKTGIDRNQEDTDRTASLKRCEPSVICSFRKYALLVEVPRGNAADRDTAVYFGDQHIHSLSSKAKI